MTSDGELLRRYTETASEAAFGELVRRHLNLVYSAALRQVNGDAHLAQDVAQVVFADLARKAASLADRPALTGWLYTSTHYTAAKAVRTEQRRHIREQEAHAMQELLHDPGPNLDWEKLRPVLDLAMHELSDSDREVILLRYFENRPHGEIGEQIGLSENAARMRVERALEKLRTALSRRDVTTTLALSTALSANAVTVAPAGLAATITTASVLAGTTLTATATAAKTIAMTTLQKTLITTTIVAAFATGIYEARQASQFRNQAQTLQQQQASLAEQIQQLRKQRETDAHQLTSPPGENERPNRDTSELLKLRGEVGMLRRQLAEAAKIKTQTENHTTSAPEPNDPLEQQKRKAGVIAKDAHVYLTAFMDYAEKNHGQFPTNWDQIRDRYNDSPDVTGTNSFEIIAHPSLNENELGTNPAVVALIREFLAWPTVDGKWAKVNGFADGHAEAVILPDGNFGAWEKQRTFNQESVKK